MRRRRRRSPPTSLDLALLGIVLVPDVLERTPPFVDHVQPGSPADKAGIRADDLVLLIGERLIQSCKTLRSDLEYIDQDDEVKLTVLRGQELLEFALRRSGPAAPAAEEGTAMTDAIRLRQLPSRTGESTSAAFRNVLLTLRVRLWWKPDLTRSVRSTIKSAFLLAAFCCLSAAGVAKGEDADAQEQAAFAAAANRAAPSIVRIETVGGLEQVGEVLFGTGPTTGVVVDPAGYVISSAFAFVNKPASILVRLPGWHAQAGDARGHRPCADARAAEDRGRQAAAGLRGRSAVGNARRAMGHRRGANLRDGSAEPGRRHPQRRRSQFGAGPSRPTPPSRRTTMAGRCWTSAAACSACSHRFRPRRANEMAGVDWYDSGIGFAVPGEHIQRVLPRLKKGEDLYPGVAGVSLKGPNLYTGEPDHALAAQVARRGRGTKAG